MPELTGLEIYNIHAAFKKRSVARLVPDIVINGALFPELTLRLIFDRPAENLERWDRLSRQRRLAGIAGNDAHQNAGLRAVYTSQDTLKLTTTGPQEVVGEWKLNGVTRFLLRLFYGPLQTGKPLFRYEADRHEIMMRFVMTHFWVRDDQELSLLDSLRLGRAYFAFDHLASARGFKFWVESSGTQGGPSAVLGDEYPLQPGTNLRVESPMPCRFTLLKDGLPFRQEVGYSWTAGIDQPGRYRLEAELRFLGEWTPWVYTNPIYLTAAR